MTMPHLMNCPHSEDGWCLSCVKKQVDAAEKLQEASRNAASQCYGFSDGLLKVEYDVITKLRQALSEYACTASK
jgi:hypothetical protein